jgi:hypothetical protein
MKELYLSVLLFLFCSYSHAQPPNTHELIIQVPGIHHSRGFPEISNQLLTINGVRIYAFCESQHLILLKIDESKLTDDRVIFDKIRSMHFDFYVKKDATIQKALSVCRDDEIPVADEVK